MRPDKSPGRPKGIGRDDFDALQGTVSTSSSAAVLASEPLNRSFPARSESVAQARHSIEAYIRPLDGADTGGVALAVSEAVGNAVRHAYRVHEPGTIQLRAELLVPDTLGVIVIDDGDGMSPHPGSEGLRLGLPLISAVTTGLEIERHKPHGTTVRMRFSLARAGAATSVEAAA